MILPNMKLELNFIYYCIT